MTVCASGGARGASTREAVEQAIAAARKGASAPPELGLLFLSGTHSLHEALRCAEEVLPIEWVGCTTAGEFTEAGVTQGGAAVMLVSWEDGVHRGSPLVDLKSGGEVASALDESLADLVARAERRGLEYITTLVFGNGLTPELERAVTALRRTTQRGHPLIGAGAGDDGTLTRSRVGNREGVVEGLVAVHVASPRPWSVAVGQGAKAITEPMTVTKASATVVEQLDGRPAIDVYLDFARSQGLEIEGDALSPFLIEHELGIYLFDEIVRMRAGYRVNDEGGVVFAGTAPAEGSTVAIVHAEAEALIEAAAGAARDALEALEGEPAGALVFSCVTRGMVLGERASEEIFAIAEVLGPNVPICGFSSYGEVARVAAKMDGYHNHAVVVALLPR